MSALYFLPRLPVAFSVALTLNSVLPSELQLVICNPNYPPEFDVEQHCEEIIPEGEDYYSLSQAIRDAADALNKAIKESEPVSWSQGDRIAIVSGDILTDEQKFEIMSERATCQEK